MNCLVDNSTSFPDADLYQQIKEYRPSAGQWPLHTHF